MISGFHLFDDVKINCKVLSSALSSAPLWCFHPLRKRQTLRFVSAERGTKISVVDSASKIRITKMSVHEASYRDSELQQRHLSVVFLYEMWTVDTAVGLLTSSSPCQSSEPLWASLGEPSTRSQPPFWEPTLLATIQSFLSSPCAQAH